MMRPFMMVTFFEGEEDDVVEKIKARAFDVLKANPWLMGRIKVGEDGDCVLEVDEAKVNVEDYVDCGVDDSLFEKECYLEICKNLEQYYLARGEPVIQGKEKLFKINLVQNQARTKLAIVINGNHQIVDAATVYSIYKQLDEHEEIVTLQRHALPDYMKKLTEHMSVLSKLTPDVELTETGLWKHKLKHNMVSKKALILKCTELAGKIKPKPHIFKINMEEINRIKSNHTSSNEANFISTNDIIMSWLASTHETCNNIGMAVSTRNRIPEVTSQHAGNYIIPVNFPREDMATPEKVRAHLNRSLKAGYEWEIPPFEEYLKYPGGLFTNWATFYHEMKIENWTQKYHMPVFPTDESIFKGPDGLIYCAPVMLMSFMINAGQVGLFVLNGYVDELTEEFFENEKILQEKFL